MNSNLIYILKIKSRLLLTGNYYMSIILPNLHNMNSFSLEINSKLVLNFCYSVLCRQVTPIDKFSVIVRCRTIKTYIYDKKKSNETFLRTVTSPLPFFSLLLYNFNQFSFADSFGSDFSLDTYDYDIYPIRYKYTYVCLQYPIWLWGIVPRQSPIPICVLYFVSFFVLFASYKRYKIC